MKTTDITVYTHTLAEKVVFNGAANKAMGVMVTNVLAPGAPFFLAASKEVIVSAGAFQSPQLLMVSGVGPKETLQAQGITVLKDLPGVGQNLWDQVRILSLFRK